FETVTEALTFTLPRPNVTYWTDIENILTNAFNDIVGNEADVAETLYRNQEEINALRGWPIVPLRSSRQSTGGAFTGAPFVLMGSAQIALSFVDGIDDFDAPVESCATTFTSGGHV